MQEKKNGTALCTGMSFLYSRKQKGTSGRQLQLPPTPLSWQGWCPRSVTGGPGKISCDMISRAGSEGDDGAHPNVFIPALQPEVKASLLVTDSACRSPVCCGARAMSSALAEQAGSQNHGTFGVGRDLCGSPSPTPCRSRVTQSRLHSTAVQAGLEYLQRRRLHNLPGQPVPGLRHPQREEVLPRVQPELPLLQFVPVAPCPVTGHH